MRRGLFIAALAATACTPLTFSNTAPIDFERYRSVYVEGAEGGGIDINLAGLSPREYLIEGLREDSGFRRVERGPGDVDVHLRVSLFIDLDRGFDREDDEYTVTADFEIYTPDGTLVDRGSVYDEDEDLYEAVEDALDEVVHHYLPSYRL